MSASAGPSVSSRQRILVVEDDRATRQFYADALAGGGYLVEQAHNGFQALEKALGFFPHLVITDIAVPGLDGIELCRRLRADPRTSHIPLLAITGHGDRRYPDRARLAGADLVLRKPCTAESLLQETRNLLLKRLV